VNLPPTPYSPSTDSPIDPDANPYEAGVTLNAWDTTLFNVMAPKAIKKFFGRAFDLDLLIAYANAIQGTDQSKKDAIPDADLVILCLMGIYYARTWKDEPFAADNLQYFLNAAQYKAEGSDTVTRRIRDHPLTDHSEFKSALCEKHFPLLMAEIKARLLAAEGTLFPSVETVIPNDRGAPIDDPRAPSVLRAGGTETLYMRTGFNYPDFLYALNQFLVASKVTVTSRAAEDAPTERLVITIDHWESWAWDTYDWHAGIGVGIEFENLPELVALATGIAAEKAPAAESAGLTDPDSLTEKFKSYLILRGLDPAILAGGRVRVEVGDVLLRRLHGLVVEVPGEGTFTPYEYELYMRRWNMYPTRTCPSQFKKSELHFNLTTGDFVD